MLKDALLPYSEYAQHGLLNCAQIEL